MINKISSYIGFAKKSKQIIIGTDNILMSSKVKIVITCSTLSENAKKKLENKFKVFVLDDKDFNNAVNMNGVKAIAITDENLASPIKNLLEVQ